MTYLWKRHYYRGTNDSVNVADRRVNRQDRGCANYDAELSASHPGSSEAVTDASGSESPEDSDDPQVRCHERWSSFFRIALEPNM